MKINIEKSVEEIKEKLHNSSDLKERKVQFFSTQLSVLFIAGLTSLDSINKDVLEPILSYDQEKAKNIIETLKAKAVSNGELVVCSLIEEAIQKLLKGFAVLLVEGASEIICFNVEKITVRGIDIPPNSTVVKGPRQGFNESLKYNLALLRERLATDKLTIESVTIGKLTQTDVAVCYLKGVANKKIIDDILKKLKAIDIDGVIDSSYLSSFLQRKPYSIFKQIGDTEKPDVLCSKLLEGRIGIIVDGSPIVLTVPFILVEDLQAEDDYFSQHVRISFIRILRLAGIVIAILLPGTYVALQLYHYKIIPLQFLITIMNTAQGIPFTPFTEIVFIILLFEVLYEANLRMPQYLGMALSIVGALILGETAVNAGLASPPAVMIVALSGLTFYTVPNQASQFGLLRLMFTLFGAVLGLFGILLGSLGVVSYLCSFDSYDSAYLGPIAPYIKNDQKDFLFKKPLVEMKTRPVSISNNKNNLNRAKIKESQKIKKNTKK